MGNKSALVLLLCFCLIFDQVYAAQKRVLKKRRKIVAKEGDSKEDEEDSASKPREKRLIGANFGLFGEEAVPITTTSYEATSISPESSYYSTVSEVYPAGAKIAIPYAVNSEDLVALEQHQQLQQQQQHQHLEAGTVYPYDSEEYRQQFYYYADDGSVIQDKTFDQVGHTIDSFLGGPEDGYDSHDDNNGGIASALVPVAVTGVLAVALSTIFINQVTLNSTSNDTLPLLWQFPDLNIGRKKRDAYEFVEDNEISSNNINTFPPSLTAVTSKLHDAFLLYTMARSSPECRSKIACAFGTAAAQNRNLGSFSPSSIGKYLKLISVAMRGFLGHQNDLSGLEMLEDLGDEFMMTGQRRSLEHDEYCSQLECSKCFSI